MTTNERDRSTADVTQPQTNPAPNDKAQERDRQGQAGGRNAEGRDKGESAGGMPGQSGVGKAASGSDYPRATAGQGAEKPRTPQDNDEEQDRAGEGESGQSGTSQQAGGSKH